MADISDKEATSSCDSSAKFTKSRDQETDCATSGMGTSEKVSYGTNSGAAGTSSGHADSNATSSATLNNDPKREILDAAVDAILTRKERPTCVREKFELTFIELDRALLGKGAVETVNRSRGGRRAWKPQHDKTLWAAVDDVVSKGMSMRASAHKHKIHQHRIKRALIERGIPAPSPLVRGNLEAAVRDVLEGRFSANTAAQVHKVGHRRLKNRLQERGCVQKGPQGPRGAQQWMKAQSGSVNEKDQPATSETPESNQKEDWSDNIYENTLSHAQKEGKLREERSLDQEATEEIERIVDVRTRRQYLVKWQGETEASWVDEDVFLGLSNLTIK
ncbi:hypothetical protein RvY_10888 [Ramazzottius varieornatus]|uniref:Chromo domain-containing protein n=1 Tax=Ramazzottius varieornatus TaxID=947166 RepID=A0A1D1VN71_RAMVA|nr:hypothetical protein RvY_10888 [Ramazzottius varieornatus]